MAFPATSKIPYAYLREGFSPRALFAFLFHFIDVGPGEGFSPYFGILPFFLALIGIWKNWANRWVRFLTERSNRLVLLFAGWTFLSAPDRLFPRAVSLVRARVGPFSLPDPFCGCHSRRFRRSDTIFSKAGVQDSLSALHQGLALVRHRQHAVVGVLTLLRRPEANDWIALSFLFLVGDSLLIAAIARGYRTAGASFLLITDHSL